MPFARTLVPFAVLTCASAALAVPTLPDFDPADFDANSSVSTHPFFPLQPGTRSIYEGVNDEGEAVRIEVLVTFQTIDIAGVQARVVRDTESVDGNVEEVTDDYFAQDIFGNVWYLGENSSDPGSWLTGVNGALPGFIMEANPQVGDNYFQEHAPNDGALDQATVLSLTESITVPFGTFDPAIKTLETTELEPGAAEQKFYGQGVGLILIEEDLDEQGVPAFTLALTEIQQVEPAGPAVPEPTTALSGLLALSFGGLLALRRR